MRNSLWTMLFLAQLAIAKACFANDTLGAVETGGIEFKKSQGIRMLSEDLFISLARIRVRYEFRNDAQLSKRSRRSELTRDPWLRAPRTGGVIRRDPENEPWMLK